MTYVIGILYLSFLCYFFYKLYKKWKNNDESEEDDSGIEFNRVTQDIEILNQLQEELNCIEHLLNVIEVCEPNEHATGITISWSDVTGNNYHYDFVIDGSDEVSELLKGIAYHERKLLRTSLKAQIRKMSAPL